ncbi:zinc-finger [Actinopolyspora lacussalsi subsp. righensis]|uniref:Zinc-finger n=1 Tax=Actinopolyspora righensis TaxID=995060 RepID=A0A1I7BRK8_9ACTN|nr:zinc finger protein [Actinopolyspora righensis]SFT89828.1 zinc-finger [Actinopolyspora righensis]
MLDSLEWQGPVVWWNPVGGWRHAFTPDQRPHPGQERETLCERTVTLIEPSDVDWLMPTCDTCMTAAIRRRDDRTERDRHTHTGPWASPLFGHPPPAEPGGDTATDDYFPWSR